MNTSKLYPPILEKTLPAFYGDSIAVSYTLNRATGFNDFDAIKLIVKSTITNEVIINKETTRYTSNSASFYFTEDDLKEVFPGGFYKIQLAFVNRNNKGEKQIGFYSNVSIAKYIGDIPNVDVEDALADNDMFIGTYECKDDITEKLYSYSFTLLDNDNQVIEETGEKLHNSTGDVSTKQREYWTPTVALNSGLDYTILFHITTINGYEFTRKKQITAKKDDSGYIPRNIELSAEMNEENGYVNIKIRSTISAITKTLIYGKFRIYRACSKDNYKQRTKVAYFSLENQDIFAKEFKDFTVEAGYKYRYILQQVNDHGIHSEEVWSTNTVEANYEHIFLFDGHRQLKIKYNPKVSSFKNTVLETKTDTIGGKYPFIFRNQNVKYKELNLSGLISYKMDEQNLFLDDADIWPNLQPGLSGKEKWTHNLTYDNITAERVFKLKVLDWLNNGEIKLFKSPTEGNYIVRLLNVSLSPTDTVGRMLHTFTATGYEVDDIKNYQFTQELIIDKTNRYIGYKTTPLYDFPKARLLANSSVVIDNREYEIIGNPNLEFVTGVHFEDVKPLTPFTVTLERNGKIFIHSFRIGATGFYAIPSELGYHIKQIRLKKEKWEEGDYAKDIINNRGQVTYEYERQAKHNNFNDITDISSNIAVGAPLYSTVIEANVEEALATIDNNPLYEYNIAATDEALIEIGYFDIDNKPTLLLKDIGYIQDGADKDGNPIYKTPDGTSILTPSKNAGYHYSKGEAIPVFETAKNPTLTINDKTQKITFNNEFTEIYFLDSNNNPKSISATSGSTPLFLPVYDSKGVQRIKRIVEKNEGEWQNPYCSYCAKDKDCPNGVFTNPINVNIYKTFPVTSVGDGEKTIINNQKIYQNLVANKYYDATNIDGEYYIKEEIQNIYNLDFELIQVFYEEDLSKEGSKQNIAIENATVSYEDIIENNGYAYTIRKIGNINRKISKKDVLRTSKELIYDYISLTEKNPNFANSIAEYTYIPIQNLADQSTFQTIQGIYNLPPLSTAETITDWIKNNHHLLTFFEKKETSIKGVFRYEEVSFPNPKDFNFDTSQLLLHPRLQGYNNYIKETTPHANEVIIVFTDTPDSISHIDLTNRFSYSISAEALGQDNLQNIAAVYMGSNVRGFMTYKRKQYSYEAVLDNGLTISLVPEEKLEEGES